MFIWEVVYKDKTVISELELKENHQERPYGGSPDCYSLRKAHELPNQSGIEQVRVLDNDNNVICTLVVSAGVSFRKYKQVTYCVDSQTQQTQDVFALECGDDKSYFIIDHLGQLWVSRTLDF